MDDVVQLLTPQGERVRHPEYELEVDPGTARDWYRDLVLVRRLDAEATALQRQGELGIWAGLLGQEAAQVGAGRALSEQDVAFPTYREHGLAWCRGVELPELLGMFRGNEFCGWDPRGRGLQPYSIVIGVQVLHAVGYAMGIQRDGATGTGDPARDAAALACFGDGAISQGDVNEAFVFAAVTQAPVVFFCQNNQWAISEPNERQSRIPLHQRARGFGFPGVRVDGNDLLAVVAVTRAALDRARAGEGPTLVEAFTYRMGAHTTSDDPSRYRTHAEVEAWKDRDPLDRVRAWLLAEGWADDDFLAEVEAASDALAVDIRRVTHELPEPDPATMFDHVYSGDHPLVAQERDWFETYRAGFADAEGSLR
jgi:2-oxoisovalerate dehydrogenase E1 component alpha subunit